MVSRGELLHGLLVAVEVSALALAISVLVGLLLALARMSRPPLTWLATAYINIFRGVPVIVTALWVFFGVSEATGINFSVFVAGVASLSLLYSAFISEIYRSALEAVPRGQREAGLALGMARIRIFVSVVLPQATKIAIPNIGSMLIGMIKDTSVLFVIGTTEVVATVQNLGPAATSTSPFTPRRRFSMSPSHSLSTSRSGRSRRRWRRRRTVYSRVRQRVGADAASRQSRRDSRPASRRRDLLRQPHTQVRVAPVSLPN